MLGQRKLLQRLVPGLMHAAIFWGFIVLFPTIVIAAIAAVDRTATLPWLGDQAWFAALADLFAVLVLLGVTTAVAIRKLVRPARFGQFGSRIAMSDSRVSPFRNAFMRKYIMPNISAKVSSTCTKSGSRTS